MLSKALRGARARRGVALCPAATARRAPRSTLICWVRISNPLSKENPNPNQYPLYISSLWRIGLDSFSQPLFLLHQWLWAFWSCDYKRKRVRGRTVIDDDNETSTTSDKHPRAVDDPQRASPTVFEHQRDSPELFGVFPSICEHPRP